MQSIVKVVKLWLKWRINLRLILTEVGITGPKPKDWRSKAKKPDNSD